MQYIIDQPASLTISRVTGGDGQPVMALTIRDQKSMHARVTIELSPADLAMALTGLAEVPGVASWHRTEAAGKRFVSERRSIRVPPAHVAQMDCNNRDALERWLEQHAQEEGWHLASSLRAQGSVERHGEVRLNYSVYRYEDSPAFELAGASA